MSWLIDKAHSQISFSVRHMMISKVKGEFTLFDGMIEFDPDNLTNTEVSITIDANSIHTRSEERDGHLRSPDFLNVAQFPHLSFKSTGVVLTDEQHGTLVGHLTIRDVTKEVKLAVTYAGIAKSPWGTTSAGFSAETEIDRKEWGLTWNQALETGGILVGDKVKIGIELELIQQ